MNDIHEGDDVVVSGKVIYVSTNRKRYLVDLPSGRSVIIEEKDIKSYRPKVKVDGEDHRKGN